MTTYTVFCAQQTPLSCELIDNLPFEFAESPQTLDFAGSVEGRMQVSCLSLATRPTDTY